MRSFVMEGPLAALALLALSVGCSGSATHEGRSASDELQSVEFQVAGMNCVSCEAQIEEAIARLDGIVEVEAVQEDARVVVKLDPALVSAGTVESRIEQLGYEAVMMSGPADRAAEAASTL